MKKYNFNAGPSMLPRDNTILGKGNEVSLVVVVVGFFGSCCYYQYNAEKR